MIRGKYSALRFCTKMVEVHGNRLVHWVCTIYTSSAVIFNGS